MSHGGLGKIAIFSHHPRKFRVSDCYGRDDVKCVLKNIFSNTNRMDETCSRM